MFSAKEVKRRIRYRNLRWKNPIGRHLLQALTWDRKENSFEEVRASILKGDLELAVRLFSIAPNVDWITRILGKEARKVWEQVKPYLKVSRHPLSLYRQCKVFLEG